MNRRVLPALGALAFLAVSGCSIKKLAVNSLGNALASGGSSYAEDDDPDLVREAVPFGLKTIESLLAESPRHRGLLLAAASGFTQYGYAFIQQEADFVESKDLLAATALRNRSRKHYKRAIEYGLRGLEVDSPGLRARLRAEPEAALSRTTKRQVPLLYWTGLAWAAAMAISKEDAELTADQYVVEAIMRRALALDEGYEFGSIHDFFIAFEGGRPASAGGSLEKARHHLERALHFARGRRAAPLVTYAETVSVSRQDRQEFAKLLEQALAVDVNQAKELRLSNLVYQKRARWLLDRTDELILE